MALRLFLALALFSQIQRPPTASGNRGVLEGIVRFSPDLPIPGVIVVVKEGDQTLGGTVADSSGAFRIEGLPSGRFQVEARRGDEILTTTSAELTAGETKNLVLELAAPVQPGPVRRTRPGEPSVEAAPEVETLPLAVRGLQRPSRETDVAREPGLPESEFLPVDHRWRSNLPDWNRYSADPSGDYPYVRGHWWDPYNQNRLKGDFPIFGRRWFLSLSAASHTLLEGRRSGTGGEFRGTENLIFSSELFRGLTVFKPVDLRFRVTPVIAGNYPWNFHASLQEAFADVRIAEVSPAFDFVTMRAGTQSFTSDFRGFVFSDNEPGVRLFGTMGANRHQYNVAYFRMLHKDPASLLNTFHSRRQDVWIGNYYIQDFIKPGYTTELSVHVNNDRERGKGFHATYLGWASDGHFGRLNVNHAFYQVLGRDRRNAMRIDARMAALELSVNRDWLRYKVSGYFASGDADIRDDRARGFDSIYDNVVFAGGPLSFWNRQGIESIKQRFSLNPSLRTTADPGESSFLNPGVLMATAGVDAELTPRLRGSVTASYLSFAHTDSLVAQTGRSSIARSIGAEGGAGVTWRPALNNNVVIAAGSSLLVPGAGLKSIYTTRALMSAFVELRLAY